MTRQEAIDEAVRRVFKFEAPSIEIWCVYTDEGYPIPFSMISHVKEEFRKIMAAR